MVQMSEQQQQQQQSSLSAIVLGYTGETGKELVKALAACDKFRRVTLLGRREAPLPPAAAETDKFETKVVDFNSLDANPESHADIFAGHDAAFCCLGTSRWKSGADGFVKVDHDYVIASAKAAKAAHVKQFHLVTSAAADKSSMFLYTRTKGQVEEDLTNLAFDRVAIYRPRQLVCDREESRFGERLFYNLLRPAGALFPTALLTPTVTLARAMVNASLVDSGNKRDLYCNADIYRMGESATESANA